MRILIWHVHGSWMTSFVQGRHDYLLPVDAERGPDGRGRARTWDWPASAVERTSEELAGERVDLVVLQRPHEAGLLEAWTGLRAGIDVPAVYLEHNAPTGPAVATRHPYADQDAVPVVHVTHFNRVMWDNGTARTTVLEHGIPDPGHLYTGERESLAVVVNEPVRRTRVAGTDLMLDLARDLPVEVYGMGMDQLVGRAPWLEGCVHEDYRQSELHRALGAHRAYLHPYRWTSLGLAMIEAMTLGLPVLGLSTTEGPRAVPAAAGLLSNDPAELCARGGQWLREPDVAAEAGAAARAHALEHYGLERFLADWDVLIEGVVA
ncbi:glycosyltransferase family 1 protein [Citricoccus sp. SGAir0253]|uniref:glycosyltransferase n=1 Tax=Citricoccus sp. SGAir0253 TaxID=2567881 RepID=UPI0010CCEE1D|nr:glycosyltransferase family 4 protein [Citricoccus sp. SGAir0253]QCU78079.1 glycosyltransferase family 1 protein [Citricoccus sp. SGAir0253]